jgi:hypothetical protein
MLLVLSSGCAVRQARLDTTRDVVLTRRGDAQCGPVGIRRASLGARWGEYVRVWVTAPTPVRGEARLHVDGRAYPLQQFATGATGQATAVLTAPGVSVEVPAVLPTPSASTQAIVLDATWTNERLDVPAALGPGHVIDVTLAGLTTDGGSCADVVFTVEQGVFQPNVDERVWVAELTRRGGPELQAWLAAEAARKEQVRREHETLHAQRRVQWEAEREARAVAFRVELEARLEADRQAEVAQVAAGRAEAAAKVEAARVEAERREAVRQAHYAAWEQRRVTRVEADVAAGGTVAMGVQAGAETVAAGGSAEAGSRVGSVTSTGGSTAGGAAGTSMSATSGVTAASDSTVSAGAASVSATAAGSVAIGGGVGVGGDVSGGAVGQLEAVAVNRESVSPSSPTEWQTPTFSTPGTERVTVSAEQARPAAPAPCGTCQPPPVRATVVDPTPALVFLDLLGAVFNLAANVQVAPRVHQAVPAPPQPVRAVPAPPPPPPARAGVLPPPPPPPPGAPR